MILFQTKCRQLTPRDGFLKDMVVLVQAWKKTHTAIRRHNWYVDVFGANCSSKVLRVLKKSELRKFGEYRSGRLMLEALDRLVGSGESQ